MNIAITGTVGSGKSGVADILAGLMRIECLDTDQICRELMQTGQAGWSDVKDRWGTRFCNGTGGLDRGKLRQAVFSEPDVRKGVEQILHPMVRAIVNSYMEAATARKEHLLVEVPLLYEAGWNSEFDHIVAVYTPAHLCIDRTAVRDNVPRKQVESILALQLSAEQKSELADSVIDNSGVWAATVLQISLLSRKLQEPGLE